MIDTLGLIIEPEKSCWDVMSYIHGHGFKIRRSPQRNPMLISLDCCSANTFNLSNGTPVSIGRIFFYAHDTKEHPAGTCLAEIELGKLIHGDNNALLSFDEVRTATKTYIETICRYFPFLDASTTRVRRADFYYQFQVNGDRHLD